ncbi:MAG: acyl-CoA thioesterase [Paracoccaceae bacterium]
MTDRPTAPCRADYPLFREITTRWMDNDVYGHVNNAVYYSFFDTVVSGYLLETGAVDPHRGQESGAVIGLAVESKCNYFASAGFPDLITGGLRVDRIGNSSVQYGVGIFANDEDQAAAAGHFIHVYVDAESRRPVPIPDHIRRVLDPLVG